MPDVNEMRHVWFKRLILNSHYQNEMGRVRVRRLIFIVTVFEHPFSTVTYDM